MAELTDELLSDLQDIHEAIEQVLFSIAAGEIETAQKAADKALHEIESAAFLQCGAYQKSLEKYRSSLRSLGMRSIVISAKFSGPHFITPEVEGDGA